MITTPIRTVRRKALAMEITHYYLSSKNELATGNGRANGVSGNYDGKAWG